MSLSTGVAIKMNLFKMSFFMLTIITTNYCYSEDMLARCHQLLTVSTSDWKEKQGNLQVYESVNDDST